MYSLTTSDTQSAAEDSIYYTVKFGMTCLISVIVPVYKTEPYLAKCLDSIVNQTYANLEIILIDDGSPDRCGNICDQYAARDTRIKVIHQQNEGLSAARNAGLKTSSGQYIGFVDSDDWIDADMFETLYGGILQYEAQIATCGYFYTERHKETEIKEQVSAVYNRDDALHLLLMDQTVTNHVWNKLFKKELFEGVLFPYGRTFEDIATTYKLFEKASKIAVLNSGKYHQIQRDDSISCSRNIHKEVDICLSTYERCVDLIGRYPEERELLLAGFYLAFANLGYAAARQRKDYFITYKNRLQAISDFAAKNRRELWKCRLVGRACKLSYTLFLRETRLASAGIRFFFFISRIRETWFPPSKLQSIK